MATMSVAELPQIKVRHKDSHKWNTSQRSSMDKITPQRSLDIKDLPKNLYRYKTSQSTWKKFLSRYDLPEINNIKKPCLDKWPAIWLPGFWTFEANSGKSTKFVENIFLEDEKLVIFFWRVQLTLVQRPRIKIWCRIIFRPSTFHPKN